MVSCGAITQSQQLPNLIELTDCTVTTAFAYTKPGGGDGMLVSSIVDSVAITTTAQQFDVLNRLTSWIVTPGTGSTATPHSYQYTYDGNSNRTSINADGTLTTLGYNAANEWMTATSGGSTANYTYDADGNELGNDGFGDPTKALTITYNAKNQTASVTDTQQNTIPMTYTGSGQAERVTAGWVATNPATPGGPATYTYGSGLLNATDTTGTTYYTRDPFGTLITQRLPNGTAYHFLVDGEGSVVRLVDAAGNVVGKYVYCPTGNDAEPPTGPAAAGNPYRQGGNFYEPSTQTYLMGGSRVDANSGNTTQIPILFINGFKMPAIAWHIALAQAAGAPIVLTYDKNPIAQNDRWEEACGGTPRILGFSCDEYPFASTFEGGVGASTALVPPREQSIQGGVLRQFYKGFQTGQQFLVIPILPPPWWPIVLVPMPAPAPAPRYSPEPALA